MRSRLWPLFRPGPSLTGHLARSDGLGPAANAEAGNIINGGLAGSNRGRPIRPFYGRAPGHIRAPGAARSQRFATKALMLLAALLVLCGAALAVPPGTEISNTALAVYDFGGSVGIESPSNTVVLVTRGPRTASKLEFMHFAPACPLAEPVRVPVTYYSTSGTDAGPFLPIPPPSLMNHPGPLDQGSALPLIPTSYFHPDEPIFLRLTDLDQNLDPELAETVLISLSTCHSAEQELLRLRESGSDTGIFVGYIGFISEPPAIPNNGVLTVEYEHEIVAEYTDGDDQGDVSRSTSWPNAAGIVFDTATGLPVNGVAVTLVDNETGLPVTIYGQDGVSIYPSTVVTGQKAVDSSGREYDLPPGAFLFPFPESGLQRLEVQPPEGYSAPSRVPDEIIQTLPGAPFAIVEPASRGGPIALECRLSTRIDIPIDPAGTDLFLTKSADREWVSPGDFAEYSLKVENTSVRPFGSVTITDMLPTGFAYQQGSTTIDGADAPDPGIASDGRTLEFAVGRLSPNSTSRLRYVTEVAAGARPGGAVNTAVATDTSGVVSNSASAKVRVAQDPLTTRGLIVGSVTVSDSCPCSGTSGAGRGGPGVPPECTGVEGVRILLEDGTYTLTDRRGMYHFEAVRPGAHVVQVDMGSLPADYAVVSCARNSRYAGRSYSQFVEVQPGLIWRADFNLAPMPQPEGEANALKARGGNQPASEPAASQPAAMPDYGEAWLATASPGLEWLWPEPGFSPPIPSLKVAVKHHPGSRPLLFLNGREVDPHNFDKTIESETGQVTLSRWSGIDLVEGDNRFRLVVTGAKGAEHSMERTIHYSGPPVEAELVGELSRLTANGIDPPVIAVRLLDFYGYPARAGVVGAFAVDLPRMSLEEFDSYQRSPLSGIEGRNPAYTVGPDGIALIKLRPTTMSGQATLRFEFTDGEQEVRVWLEPEARDWILVGLAEGTVGYNTLSGNMERLESGDVEDQFYQDGRVAFYAKGRVKGSWLLTAAYDTEGQGTGAGSGFFQTVDPDAYYTLYGDASEQYYDSPSGEHLYVRLERREFYALFGDYNTGLTVTELSKYSRTFTGIKSELKTGAVGFDLFGVKTRQASLRDEIRGDGTSGLYRMSHPAVVMNSEKVMLETRDRFRSELVISSRRLTRHIDYDIDYDEGTLFFREPVPSKDQDLNHVFIVIEYESEEASVDAYTYGGRGSVLLGSRTLELGATYVHDEQHAKDGDLAGADATLKVGTGGELRAEFAGTRVGSGADEAEGTAYLAEYRHRLRGGDYRLYVRELDQRFGLGQQNAGEIGTRKFGVDIMQKLGPRFNLDGLAYRHYNLATDGVRDVGEARLNFSGDRYCLRGGYRYASDTLPGGPENRSDQLTLGAALKLFHSSLSLRLDHDQSLGQKNANPDFPTRTILGADYDLGRDVTAFAEYEVTRGDYSDTQASRLGLKATPWSGARLNSSLRRSLNEAGTRVFANLGLRQTWCFHENWCADASLDHSRLIRHKDTPTFNDKVPPASGTESDFLAVSAGLAYREPTWSANSRLEWRRADDEEKWTLIATTFGEPRNDLGLSVRARLLRASRDDGVDRISGDIRLGLAVRPPGSRWTLLDRLDLKTERLRGDGSASDRRQIVNSFTTNCRVTGKDQAALQYASKYSGQDFAGSSFTGYTDLLGLELRHDLSEKWDLGVRGSRLCSWNSRQSEYGAGLSIGYSMVTNTWVSLGYNVVGYEDKDFSGGDYSARGPFLKLRVKVDQESLADLSRRGE